MPEASATIPERPACCNRARRFVDYRRYSNKPCGFRTSLPEGIALPWSSSSRAWSRNLRHQPQPASHPSNRRDVARTQTASVDASNVTIIKWFSMRTSLTWNASNSNANRNRCLTGFWVLEIHPGLFSAEAPQRNQRD
jgi:hypothetical protein